jgi:hypothetical protein
VNAPQSTASVLPGVIPLNGAYGYGVVFANIPRAQLNTAISLDAQELRLPPHLVICQDEMSNKVEAESFQKRRGYVRP